MGSLLKAIREIREARKKTANRKKKRNKFSETEAVISKKSMTVYRIIMCTFFTIAIVHSAYAPNKAPKLPEGFCEFGDVTATTGECMCHWQDKSGCVGSGCEFQMGLSFYHHSCKDCRCVKEP